MLKGRSSREVENHCPREMKWALNAELWSKTEDSEPFKDSMGLGCGSMTESFLSMLKAPGSRPSARKQQWSHTQHCPAQKTFRLDSGEITDGQEGGEN